MISVVTKTGDSGQTGLANGERRLKSDLVFGVVGTLDELNAWLGVVVAGLRETFPQLKRELLIIQDTLFYVGAEVVASPKAKLMEGRVTELENWLNQWQGQMADGWHTKFIYPGGTELGAWLDVARTVCRRAERELVLYTLEKPLSPTLQHYLNRLSDYLYVIRCWINHELSYQEKQFEVSQ